MKKLQNLIQSHWKNIDDRPDRRRYLWNFNGCDLVLKFVFSKMATNIDQIVTVDLTFRATTAGKAPQGLALPGFCRKESGATDLAATVAALPAWTVKIWSIFVAFLENMPSNKGKIFFEC